MPKYTIREVESKEKILEINGIQSKCPYTPAIPIKTEMSNRMALMTVPCSSQCPHASHSDEIWMITCGGKELRFKLEAVEKQGETPIIKL